MANGNTEESVMDDILDSIIDEIIDTYKSGNYPIASDIENVLSEYGLMIVPIEDPTNLRFGVE